jgi:hypothetical protein
LDWVEGRLDPERAEAVEALLREDDPATAETVAWIRDFLAGAGLMPLHELPAEASAELHEIVRLHASAWAPSAYDDASPVADSTGALPATGTRAGGASDVAHLVFDSDAGRLGLDVARVTSGRVDVHGRFAPAADDRAERIRIVFTRARRVRGTTICSVSGEFTARDVPTDVDEVWVVAGDRVVRAAVAFDTLEG